MDINPDLISPCGLYCGVCGIFYATRDNDQKFLQVLLKMYKARVPDPEQLTTDDLRCDGCHSDRRSFFCRTCSIRECSKDKRYTGCHKCHDFPCELIQNFPVPVGRKVILRSVPYRRKHGTEKWIQDEENRYYCPECNNRLFRGATRCNQCGKPVSPD